MGALALAQIIPSCGGEDQPIVGWVAHKFLSPVRDAYIIEINNVEYEVPPEFYDVVKIGDLVKRENGVWRIVKPAGGG